MGFLSSRYSLGGDRGGMLGWMGMGGSCMHWHPRLGVGAAYAMDQMVMGDEAAGRNVRVVRALLRCLGEAVPEAPALD